MTFDCDCSPTIPLNPFADVDGSFASDRCANVISGSFNFYDRPFVTPLLAGSGNRTMAVSYTHLDVYKRQPLTDLHQKQ